MSYYVQPYPIDFPIAATKIQEIQSWNTSDAGTGSATILQYLGLYTLTGSTTGNVQAIWYQIDDGPAVNINLNPDGTFSVYLTPDDCPNPGPNHAITIYVRDDANVFQTTVNFSTAP